MNTSTAFSQWNGSGYIAIYSPYWTSAQEQVTDERGHIRIFHDRYQAECFAWRALRAAEEQIKAERYDPSKRTGIRPSFVLQPRSRAGRKALFNSIFKEGAEA
jgi:hypothetical protein